MTYTALPLPVVAAKDFSVDLQIDIPKAAAPYWQPGTALGVTAVLSPNADGSAPTVAVTVAELDATDAPGAYRFSVAGGAMTPVALGTPANGAPVYLHVKLATVLARTFAGVWFTTDRTS